MLRHYDPAAIVIRHPYAGAAQMVANWTSAAVVNAGDGKHEHPSQALLDVYTLQRSLRGRVVDGLGKALEILLSGWLSVAQVRQRKPPRVSSCSENLHVGTTFLQDKDFQRMVDDMIKASPNFTDLTQQLKQKDQLLMAALQPMRKEPVAAPQ